jgi:hypothetical protein
MIVLLRESPWWPHSLLGSLRSSSCQACRGHLQQETRVKAQQKRTKLKCTDLASSSQTPISNPDRRYHSRIQIAKYQTRIQLANADGDTRCDSTGKSTANLSFAPQRRLRRSVTDPTSVDSNLLGSLRGHLEGDTLAITRERARSSIICPSR